VHVDAPGHQRIAAFSGDDVSAHTLNVTQQPMYTLRRLFSLSLSLSLVAYHLPSTIASVFAPPTCWQLYTLGGRWPLQQFNVLALECTAVFRTIMRHLMSIALPHLVDVNISCDVGVPLDDSTTHGCTTIQEVVSASHIAPLLCR
jgi:hypothetical protein